MKHAVLLSLVMTFGLSPVAAADGKRPMKVEDLFAFKRVADPQISPDGKTVAYVVTTVDLPGNKTSSSIWLAPTDKGQPRQLTNTSKKDRHPRWSPDGQRILFESNRSGENQLWVIDVGGGEARQLTTISSEASNALWSPDGKHVAFVSAVYPEYSDKPFKESDALNKKRKEEIEKSPVKAKVFTRLFYRHWDEWVEDKRQHLFVMSAGGGEPKDVTPGDRDAFPTSDTFSTGDNFTFSPDSTYLVYTAPPAKNEAWSTNYDICRVPITGGRPECLTKDNLAADSGPCFFPNGPDFTFLAYRAQKRPGFEADKWELMVVKCDDSGRLTGKPRSITADVDLSAGEFVWWPTGLFGATGGLVFTAEQGARTTLCMASAMNSVRGCFLLGDGVGTLSAVSVSRDGKLFSVSGASLRHPSEVFVLQPQQLVPTEHAKGNMKTDVRNMSHANTKTLGQLDLPRPESVEVQVEGAKMQMWTLKPPGFDPKKKWPLAFLVHGGPQGAWEDGWSFRWNAQVWAAQGYVVALPNPRGSTGFGQKYVDEISGDWGGKCYDDLMAGLAYLEKLPHIDTDRMAAAGASFGGYMMNWFQGHTTKFKTLITHCGVYNHESMYALTEELWFDEWEHGAGRPLWQNRESYRKHSPHLFAENFKTPMLIIHNDLDFRVPVAEGLQLFTTLQRLGVPSKMINFPDEGHWVLKPKNSEYWHKEVFAWLKKYVPPGGR